MAPLLKVPTCGFGRTGAQPGAERLNPGPSLHNNAQKREERTGGRWELQGVTHAHGGGAHSVSHTCDEFLKKYFRAAPSRPAALIAGSLG